VRVQMSVFSRSLFVKDRADAGRSQGFFVMVRDRLINPDDAKLFLHEPSYGVFNRMQIFIWADGLDADLLADRERVHREAESGKELEFLQVALYREARSQLQQRDSAASNSSSITSGLPRMAREIIHEPLAALLANEPSADLSQASPSETRLTTESGGASGPLARLDATENRIVTNTDHPVFTTVTQSIGVRKSREAQKLVELYAIADLLLKGHLLDLGIQHDMVDKIMTWREAQLRALIEGFNERPDLVVKEVHDRSFKGGKAFEQALAKLFRGMGFTAEIDGASGKKDVLVVAPVGEDERRFTVEAKGSNKPLANDSAEISGASAHAADVDAALANVVSRELA
jgi:hypothetical protein